MFSVDYYVLPLKTTKDFIKLFLYNTSLSTNLALPPSSLSKILFTQTHFCTNLDTARKYREVKTNCIQMKKCLSVNFLSFIAVPHKFRNSARQTHGSTNIVPIIV